MTTKEFYERERDIVQRKILELEESAKTSESVSSANGGSYSASSAELTKYHNRLDAINARLAEIYRETNGGSSLGISYQIYCGG